MRGIFLDVSTITEDDLDLDPIRSTLPDWNFDKLTAPGDVSRAIRDADIVISNKAMIDRQAIEAAQALRLICIAATGTNNVDLEAARDKQVTVCNVRGYATRSVVEHVFMLILALNRRLAEHTTATRDGRWQRATRFSMLDFPFSELSGQTLGIIGYGELGKAVALMAQAFDMRVLVAERAGRQPRPGRCPFETLLAEANIITLHCPLTAATENLLDMAALRQMRSDAILINTARGGIVNEADLLAALQTGVIAAAGLDVLSTEPPIAGSPLLDAQLQNLIITPHVAWAGRRSRQTLVQELAGNIRAFLAGNPRNLVTY